MKKLIVLLILLSIIFIINAQSTDIETVREIQAEREMADWIESMLYPIVGDNVAIVDMTLRYPSEKLKVFGSTLDTERSLPGLPVARSSGVMPSEVAGEETYPTIILSKVVTIYLSKNTTEEMEQFVRQNVMSWVNINEAKGDGLEVKRVLNLKAEQLVDEDSEPAINAEDYRNYILIIAAILLLIILTFIIIFSLRMQALAKSLKEVNIPGLENALRPAPSKNTQGMNSLQNKAIDVRIMPEDKDNQEISFRFLEELSIKGFAGLLLAEKPEIAAYVLSQLSPEYAGRFFIQYEKESSEILRAVIEDKPISHSMITKIHAKLQKACKHIAEEENLSFDNRKFVTNIINNLPVDAAKKVFQQVGAIDLQFADKMRKDVFLMEDIINLDDNQLRQMIKFIDRSLLVSYLTICSNTVKTRFFDAMTTRNQEIFKEEIEHTIKLSKDDGQKIEDKVVSEIRSILGLM